MIQNKAFLWQFVLLFYALPQISTLFSNHWYDSFFTDPLLREKNPVAFFQKVKNNFHFWARESSIEREKLISFFLKKMQNNEIYLNNYPHLACVRLH